MRSSRSHSRSAACDNCSHVLATRLVRLALAAFERKFREPSLAAITRVLPRLDSMPQWSATAWVAASRAAVWGRDDVQIVRKAIKVSPACKLFPTPPPLARAPFLRGGSQGPKLFEELFFW